MQGGERNPRPTILKSSRSRRGTSLGGRAHRHPLTRITGDQAGSGIGQPQGRRELILISTSILNRGWRRASGIVGTGNITFSPLVR